MIIVYSKKITIYFINIILYIIMNALFNENITEN